MAERQDDDKGHDHRDDGENRSISATHVGLLTELRAYGNHLVAAADIPRSQERTKIESVTIPAKWRERSASLPSLVRAVCVTPPRWRRRVFMKPRCSGCVDCAAIPGARRSVRRLHWSRGAGAGGGACGDTGAGA